MLSPSGWLLLLATLATGACGGGDLVLPSEGQPAELAVVRGNGQNGTIGEALGDSLVVRVTDRFGNPVRGVEVTWTAEGGGTTDPVSTMTGVDGRAATLRTLGTEPGSYTTVATVAGLADAPVIFTNTAVAAQLALTTQPSFTATSGVPFERQPVLQLEDPDGDPIARPNVAVTVQIAAGGGTLSGVTTALSNAEGVAAFTGLAIRGSPGARTLIFAADGFASATSAPIGVGVGGAASIGLVTGDGQSATVGTAVPTAPAVVVRDADGNPVPGVPIKFTVASGKGQVTGGSPITGDDGTAAVGGWTLGQAAGANTLRAEVPGAELSGSPIIFTATGVAGPLSVERTTVSASPTSIPASAGSSASTITVRAQDEFGNPLAGLAVVLSATGSGNTLTQPDSPTDENGVATGRLSATGLGNHVVSATVAGSAITQTATVTVTPGAPVADSSSASAPSGTAGAATTITIQLKDAQGNLVSGAASEVDVRVSGANTAGPLTVTDRGGGAYTASYTPTVAGDDQIVVRVGGTPIPSGSITSVVVAGPSDPGRTTAEVTRSPVFFFFKIDAVVTVRDAQGNRVGRGGDQVAVTMNGSGLSVTDNRDGTYSANAFTGEPAVTIVITLNGSPISGSPFFR
ncbi:MAG: Ig-like domain-containing protein [Nocardioidaceae bacterium]